MWCVQGAQLGGSEEEAHASGTSQEGDGGGARGSSPSSHQVNMLCPNQSCIL